MLTRKQITDLRSWATGTEDELVMKVCDELLEARALLLKAFKFIDECSPACPLACEIAGALEWSKPAPEKPDFCDCPPGQCTCGPNGGPCAKCAGGGDGR